MKFLDTGEKIRNLRRELQIKQEELNASGVSRNFISMVEHGRRKLPHQVAIELIKIFTSKADKLGVKLELNEHSLMASAKEEATEYCIEKLHSNLTPEDIDSLAAVVKEYSIRELIPKVYMLKANNLYDERLYEEAFTYYYEILQCTIDKQEIAYIYNKLGKCKLMMLNYIEAIAYLSKCYEYSLSSGDDTNKRNSLYNMALSYRRLANAELALDYVKELISLCDMEKDFEEYISAVILKSNCYIQLKKYQEAIDILLSNVANFSDPQDKLLGYIYNSLGVLFLDTDNFNDAMEYIERASRIRETRDTCNLPITLINKAQVLIKQKKVEEAHQVINKAMNLAEINKDNEFMIKAYKLLEDIYSQAGRTQELKDLYLKMINLFNITANKEELVKSYIKLLKLISNTNNMEEYKRYLEDVAKLV